MIVIEIILMIVFGYLALNAVYLFIYAVIGRLRPLKPAPENNNLNRFAIYVACYKGDQVILSTVLENLKVDYPKDKYELIVIGDSFQPETVQKLKTYPIRVIEVNFENSTKAKSLIAAVEQTEDAFDYAIILDIDNVMAPDFLRKMNNHLRDNKLILQGHRVALNEDTAFAKLDAISEEINNHIFRSGHISAGLSAAFIGSGKALQFDFYKSFINDIRAIGGFDKEMELKLLGNGHRIHYAEEALVYDEKVQQADRFQNQRKRWLSAQFHYFGEHIGSGLLKLFTKGNIDYFDKVIQMILFPRVLLIGTLFLFAFASLVIPQFPNSQLWQAIFVINAFTLAISIPLKMYNADTFKAIIKLPLAFLLMFKTLFQLKGANKKFIHTEHSHSATEKSKQQ